MELLASDTGVDVGSFGDDSGKENVTFLGLLFGLFCTPGTSVDVHVPIWSPPLQLLWGFWVLHLLLAGWVQQALLNFAPQHSLLLAYATLASIVVNYNILGPTHFQHSLHIPYFLPTSGFAMWALKT